YKLFVRLLRVAYTSFPSLYAGTITVQDGNSASLTEVTGLYLKNNRAMYAKKPNLKSNRKLPTIIRIIPPRVSIRLKFISSNWGCKRYTEKAPPIRSKKVIPKVK